MASQKSAPWLKPIYVTYGMYAWSVLGTLGAITLVISLIPGLPLNWRRTVAHFMVRLFLLLSGIRLHVLGLKSLPPGSCVVVANHASYVDGIILKAALPGRFSYVIKKEIVRVPLVGLLLRRIGAEFVDRFNRHSAGMDARRLIKTASRGGSLVFFPEGTFTDQPGVNRFHNGAFATAVSAGLPVVPVAIVGTRNVLPHDAKLLRPGLIEVRILPAVHPLELPERSRVVEQLKNEARTQILSALDEPDLASNNAIVSMGRQRTA